MYDVLLYADDPAGAFSPSLNASRPTGGTEIHLVQLAEGLGRTGLLVIGVSEIPKDETTEYAVYCHPPRMEWLARWRTKILITAGLTKPPEWVKADRHLVLWTHDAPHNLPHLEAAGLRWSEFICVSHWQASRFPRGWKTRIIPPIIDDWIYDLPPVTKRRGKYVCLSAWWKGTRQTLELWPQVHPAGAELVVGSPYSHPPEAREMVERTPGCRWVELPTPRAVVEEMRDAEGVFRVATAPETFGITDVIAQILGCRIHAFAPSGFGGAEEALAEPIGYASNIETFLAELTKPADRCCVLDLRASKIIPRWRRLLDL